MRRALLLVMLVSGIALVVWSGYQNVRQRRLAAQATHVTLVPDGAASASTDSTATPSPLLGKHAPPLDLQDLNGKRVTLDDFKGHPLVVNYWATYCEPCKFEMPWLESLSKKYASDGFDVIGIDFDSEVGKEVVSKNVKKLGVTYPILLSDRKTEKDYLRDSDGLPMSFFVDRTGKIVEVTMGLGSEDELEAMVKATIAAGGK